MPGGCLDGVLRVCGRSLEGVLGYLEGIYGMSEFRMVLWLVRTGEVRIGHVKAG